MKHPGFTFCSLLLGIVAAIAVLNAGPCDGLEKIEKAGTAIGEKIAEQELKALDEHDAQIGAEVDRYMKEIKAGQAAN